MSRSGDNVGADQIKAFVERILRMKEEARAINDDIREIYAEAKGNGFDKTVLGQVVSYVEKRQKDPDTLAERSALFDLYIGAIDGTGTQNALTHTHENTDDEGRVAQPGSAPQQRSEATVSGSRPDASSEDHDPRAGSNPAPIPLVDTHPRNSKGIRKPEGCQQIEMCRVAGWRDRCKICEAAFVKAHAKSEAA